MSGIQLGFLIFTFVGPLLLWILSRHLESIRFATAICRTFALALVGAWAGTMIIHWRAGDLTPDFALPMQLCDWALAVTVVALTLRRQLCFELAYFWGLAGTAQALITPAVDTSSIWRIIGFFVIHSVIPASVLWLMFEFKMRPLRGAWLRVLWWSQVYLVLALLTNAATGGNYGFLSRRPAIHSMLDFFPNPQLNYVFQISMTGESLHVREINIPGQWLYVILIDLTGLVIFLVLDLPWQFIRRRQAALAKTAGSLS